MYMRHLLVKDLCNRSVKGYDMSSRLHATTVQQCIEACPHGSVST